MAKKKKYVDWDKCIHIHACRRFAEIVKRKTGKIISRGCGMYCDAYEEKENEEMIEKACKWLEENKDGYACAEYIPDVDAYPDAWVHDLIIDDFKEYMQNDN